MKHFLEILGDLMLVVYGLFFLWVFIWVGIYGYMRIVEGNWYILIVEVLGAIGMVVLGVILLRRDVKR